MDEQMMTFLKEMRDEMNKRFDELQNEISVTQHAVLYTSGEVKAILEEELHILKEKQ